MMVEGIPAGLAEHCFKPGQSGNPLGRKGGAPTLKEVIDKLLREPAEKKPKDYMALTKLEVFARTLYRKAVVDGDTKCMAELFARLWPAPRVALNTNINAKIGVTRVEMLDMLVRAKSGRLPERGPDGAPVILERLECDNE